MDIAEELEDRKGVIRGRTSKNDRQKENEDTKGVLRGPMQKKDIHAEFEENTRTCVALVLLPSKDSHLKLDSIDVTTPGSRSWKLFEHIVLLLVVHSLVGISSFVFIWVPYSNFCHTMSYAGHHLILLIYI